MIPRTIHYCWLSNDPLPDNIQRCIDSWERILKGYEIIKWDQSHIDLSAFPWMNDAFSQGKYAFAADYVRAYALFKYGGIYLDSDVEVLRSFDELLHLPYFFGMERFDSSNVIEAAVMGSAPGNPLFKDMMEWYDNHDFSKTYGSDCYTCPQVLGQVLRLARRQIKRIARIQDFTGRQNEIYVFPASWFSPKDLRIGRIRTTPMTFCIHHFAASWQDQQKSLGHNLHRLLGDFIYYNFLARPYFALQDFMKEVI